jgi:hypothetical protein
MRGDAVSGAANGGLGQMLRIGNLIRDEGDRYVSATRACARTRARVDRVITRGVGPADVARIRGNQARHLDCDYAKHSLAD